MPEFFELGIDKSAVSIVQRHGDAAAKKIAAEAVEQLQAGDFHSYEVLKQILKDIEDLLAQRRGGTVCNGASKTLC